MSEGSSYEPFTARVAEQGAQGAQLALLVELIRRGGLNVAGLDYVRAMLRTRTPAPALISQHRLMIDLVARTLATATAEAVVGGDEEGLLDYFRGVGDLVPTANEVPDTVAELFGDTSDDAS
jgi:hypothetical protein